MCNVPGVDIKSIFFGLEKSGSLQLIDTAKGILTDESRLRYGTKGLPAKLSKHLEKIAGAFKNRKTRPALPYSIRGLWKADLFCRIFGQRSVGGDHGENQPYSTGQRRRIANWDSADQTRQI
jgi:hypothetical protein